MNPTTKKFLEFNGKEMYFTLVDQTWWIALKPICDALNVDYTRQFKNVKSDKKLSQLLSKQTIVAADGRQRKMLCLPEKYIYGWIFRLRSDSKLLLEYQHECYEVLYDHFHGAILQRHKVINERLALQNEVAELEQELQKDETFIAWTEKKKLVKGKSTLLTYMDKELISGVKQGNLFD